MLRRLASHLRRRRGNPSATLRRGTIADHDRIIEIWMAANKLAHPFLDDHFLSEEEDNIRTVYLPAAETWVAESNDQVVGFMSLLGHQVGGLFVSPAWLRQGIGRALMDKAVEQRGPLEVDVFKANAIGRQFYHRYGFVEADDYMHAPTGQRVLRLAFPAA